MARFSLNTYREQWPRVGGVLAMAVGGATALASKTMPRTQALSATNFGALLVHQNEEYVDPGWFPGQFNKGLFKSDSPRNYPLNRNSALCVNTVFAYPYYVTPILFPRSPNWVRLGPVIFGISQAVSHGVAFPRIAGDKYSPGFLASLLLHVPIGITQIRAVRAEGPITAADWIKTAAYTVAFAATAIGGPNLTMKNKNSPYAFDAHQMGRYENAAQ